MFKSFYHIVSFSPWPSIVSINLFNLITSLILYNNFKIFTLIFLNFILSVLLWVLELIIESTILGNHTKKVSLLIINGFILFLLTEVIIFGSLFISLYYVGIKIFFIHVYDLPYLGIPLLNIIILILSGVSVTLSQYYYHNRFKLESIYYKFTCITFCMIFIYFQYIEFKSNNLSISDNFYGSVFYSLTGLHGIHMILGTTILLSSLIKFVFCVNNNTKNINLLISSLNLHFLDIVYIFIYLFLYFVV